MSDRPELLTIAEAAQLLTITVATLNAWRLRGSGPPWLKLGAAVRYDRSMLEEWLHEQVHAS